MFSFASIAKADNFVPSRNDDRPKVVPELVVNIAFIGQLAETERQHRVLGAHGDGSGLHVARHRTGYVGGVGVDVRPSQLKSMAVSRD
jgi:hypothetical protein